MPSANGLRRHRYRQKAQARRKLERDEAERKAADAQDLIIRERRCKEEERKLEETINHERELKRNADMAAQRARQRQASRETTHDSFDVEEFAFTCFMNRQLQSEVQHEDKGDVRTIFG